MTTARWIPAIELSKRLGVSRQALGGILSRYGVEVRPWAGRLWIPERQAEYLADNFRKKGITGGWVGRVVPPPEVGPESWVPLPEVARELGLNRLEGTAVARRFHGRVERRYGILGVSREEADRIEAQYRAWKASRQEGLSTIDVARKLGVAVSTVHTQRVHGRLKAEWGDGRWVYDPDSVAEYEVERRARQGVGAA